MIALRAGENKERRAGLFALMRRKQLAVAHVEQRHLGCHASVPHFADLRGCIFETKTFVRLAVDDSCTIPTMRVEHMYF
jgi:hypothetical protein